MSDEYDKGCNFGTGCTGTPPCGTHKCGNLDDMCYCDCDVPMKCKTTDLGYKWNDGIKMVNDSYALSDTKCEILFNLSTIYCRRNGAIFIPFSFELDRTINVKNKKR